MTVVFVSQVAGTLIVLPVGGLMAHTVAENAKGRATGWYQAGNLGGSGVGVWLASHFSKEIAGGGLAIAMLASAGAIYFVSDVRIVSTETIGERMRILWGDILSMVRAAIPLFTIVLVCSPIGAGAMNNLWSAVAPDWSATPDQVALVSGVLNGVVSTIGCVIGGWVADRVGRWWSYFGSGILMAMVAIIMAVTARTPNVFSVGVLAYALTCGMAYAAFSAIVLLAIGRGAASTKYATLSSLGNLPVVYMTASDGWVHDRFGTAWMLHSEALIAILCIVLGLAVLRWINPPRRAKTDLVLP
jgi:PAT family beta-lactamase induction signal transducer AmpG